MLVIFAVVTVSGHGTPQPAVYHEQEHNQNFAHVIDGHDHEDGVIISILNEHASTTVDLCAESSCDSHESDPSSAHFHIPCCGTVLALLHTEIGIKSLVVSPIDQPIGRSSVVLGELRYPLLRPPRQLL